MIFTEQSARPEMEGKRLKYGFLANHDVLVGRVEPLGLLPFLVAEGVVTFEDEERIKHEITSTAKVDKLLSVVHRRGVTDEKVYERFLKVLKEAGDLCGQDLDDVVRKIEEDANKEGIEKRFEYAVGILEEHHNAVLKANEHAIVSNLNVEDVLPQLVSSGVVTHEENVAVRNEVTQNKRAESLVKIIHRRGSAAFEAFVSALDKSEGYHELSSLLSEGGGVSAECDQRWGKLKFIITSCSFILMLVRVSYRIFSFGGCKCAHAKGACMCECTC